MRTDCIVKLSKLQISELNTLVQKETIDHVEGKPPSSDRLSPGSIHECREGENGWLNWGSCAIDVRRGACQKRAHLTVSPANCVCLALVASGYGRSGTSEARNTTAPVMLITPAPSTATHRL
jgi:hypothetical protein